MALVKPTVVNTAHMKLIFLAQKYRLLIHLFCNCPQLEPLQELDGLLPQQITYPSLSVPFICLAEFIRLSEFI